MTEGRQVEGGHGVRERVKEYRRAGRGDMKDEKQVGEEHGVREGVSEGGREVREIEKLRRGGR